MSSVRSLSSVADPERFDADPDPTFQADADGSGAGSNIFLARERTCFFLPILHFFLLHNLTKLVMFNFLINDAGGGARGEG